MQLPKALKRTGIVFFPAFDWSISPTHPEREERLLYTRDQIFEEGLMDVEGIREYAPLLATEEDFDRVHACFPDAPSLAGPSHQVSAGGAIAAAKAVMDGEVESSFALVRPPGHHATRVVRGLRGFCIVNIEAVMIEYIRRHYRNLRVAIVDTDCHHGDGTQDIYWNDPNTLFISLHQDGRTLYPGSGFPSEFGGPNGYGTTLNIPLPPNSTDEAYHYVLDNFVLPVLDDWKPDLIINSAGQDNHFTDPITNMSVTAQGYAEITRKLNPHIAVLEGGYSVQSALPYVNTGILMALAGMDTGHLVEPDFHPGVRGMDDKTGEYLKKLCELMVVRYKHRDELAAKEFGDKSHHTESRTLFHDEAGISEEQFERVTLCKECAGMVTLESDAGRGEKMFLVQIPLGACPKCVSEGLEAYGNVGANDYDLTILQNRPEDVVEKKGRVA